MTNAKVYQGFHDDKKVEEHCSGFEIKIPAYSRTSKCSMIHIPSWVSHKSGYLF